MNLPRLTPEGEAVLSAAILETVELGHHFLGVEHLFLGLARVADQPLADAFEKQMLELAPFTELLRSKITGVSQRGQREEPTPTPRCLRVFELASRIATRGGSPLVGPDEVRVAIFREGRSVPLRLLRALGADVGGLRDAVIVEPREEAVPTSLIEKFGRDLTLLAAREQLSPVIGRAEEMDLLAQVLLRKGKNNPVLVGEAGVGKTAIVEGLAQRLAGDDCPEPLRNRRLVELSLSALVAGTKYRGEFEERLVGITQEAAAHPEIVLFLDEIHTVVGAGSTGGGDTLDASNILKPALARGEIRCIGATTIDEFRRTIEKDPALDRRFEKVLVEEPSPEDCLEILQRLKTGHEEHHGVVIAPDALAAAVELTVQHVHDRQLPDKALDAIDQSCARRRLQRYADHARGDTQGDEAVTITDRDVAATVSSWTGIPLERISGEAAQGLLGLEDELRSRVFGQDDAVRAVARTVLTAKAGLSEPNRPLGVFLFAGPTGVGKTYLAKVLAERLFDDSRRLVRIDMSEYMEAHSVSNLIGAPPGYVGHEKEGVLISALRTHPHSVVLFDEVEKAHPQVWDLFLQVFDEGQLTGTSGKTADFTQAILILTTNLDTSPVTQEAAIGFGAEGAAEAEAELVAEAHDPRDVLVGVMRPELVNRIDEVVTFRPLGRESLRRIVDHAVAGIEKLLEARSVKLELDDAVYEHLLGLSKTTEFGAREIHRVIDRHMRQPLAHALLQMGNDVSRIRVAMGPDGLDFHGQREDEGQLA